MIIFYGCLLVLLAFVHTVERHLSHSASYIYVLHSFLALSILVFRFYSLLCVHFVSDCYYKELFSLCFLPIFSLFFLAADPGLSRERARNTTYIQTKTGFKLI